MVAIAKIFFLCVEYKPDSYYIRMHYRSDNNSAVHMLKVKLASVIEIVKRAATLFIHRPYERAYSATCDCLRCFSQIKIFSHHIDLQARKPVLNYAPYGNQQSQAVSTLNHN